jgi:SAM-dependent methyltransferase
MLGDRPAQPGHSALPSDWAAAVAPRAPHDGLSFEELSRSYSFLQISAYARVLTNLLRDEMGRRTGAPVRVLDVGCGRGLGRAVDYQWAIRDRADEFWGIEPDASVEPPEGLFDHFQHALMETAELPTAAFDVVYSSMVMEHVRDPDQFMEAVHRSLKPGGVYLFATPNAKSLVPWLTRTLHQLRLDERALRLVKRQQAVAEYHYPVQFRFNTPAAIDAYAQRIGFAAPEYVFIEGSGSRAYFPGPLRPVYQLLVLKRKIIKNPRRLATLICRMTKHASSWRDLKRVALEKPEVIGSRVDRTGAENHATKKSK